jgi:hypothetical protein
MTTKTITKNRVIAALKKDLDLLKLQQNCIKTLIKTGAGQFLNVGNDEWCGGKSEVLRLYRTMIGVVNKAIDRLSNTNCTNLDVVGDLFEARTEASEAWVLLSGEDEEEEGLHHSMLPNYQKLLG